MIIMESQKVEEIPGPKWSNTFIYGEETKA